MCRRENRGQAAGSSGGAAATSRRVSILTARSRRLMISETRKRMKRNMPPGIRNAGIAASALLGELMSKQVFKVLSVALELIINNTLRIQKPNGFHLLESPLSKDQEMIELDDEYEITATVVDTEQLNWWLRGFGDAVRGVKKNTLKN